MQTGGIDAQRIASMLTQLRAAAQRPEGLRPEGLAQPVTGKANSSAVNTTSSASNVSFSDALKASLEQVNSMQLSAEKAGQAFAMGDDSVSLSDVMIAGQKANIAFQATVQVRNKLVSAYQDMMNMQI